MLSQKIVSLIQNRIIYKEFLRVGFWAKFFSKFVKKTPHGFSVGNPLKMQVAINLAGLPRIFLAGVLGIIAKLFGKSGVFYKVAGHQISEIDGFYGEAFPQYSEIAILGSINNNELCNKLRDQYGFSFIIADINDLGGNILGKSQDLEETKELLLKILADNPAGQAAQQTPIIILRKQK